MTIETHEANERQLRSAVQAAEALRPAGEEAPAWAVALRDVLPAPGFEIHCVRWLDGLDAVLLSIRQATFTPCAFGRYGDYPGFILNGVEQRASVVQDWLDGRGGEVAAMLGERTARKEEAARCFVQIARAFVGDQDPEGQVKRLGESWRKRAAENEILGNMFHGEGLDRGLFGGASYWTLHRLDLVLRVAGGDTTDIEDLAGSCNYELRNVLRDDPGRMHVTHGYLWGIWAYLSGRDASWLRAARPQGAGAAIHAHNSLARSRAPENVSRWLAAAFLVAVRYWYQRAVVFASQKGPVPGWLREVPSLAGECSPRQGSGTPAQ